MNSDLFSSEIFKRHIELVNGELSLYENFYTSENADHLFDALKESIAWKQDHINIYGKTHIVPRLTGWYGDKNIHYSYSNIKLIAQGWTPILAKIKAQIEAVSKHDFNSCLLNYYKNGQHSMGWHQDNEPELGHNPIIASLTLGATRNFQLKHFKDKSLDRVDLPLKNGTLLIMQGSTQHYWKHQIPKTKRKVGERINLTFRKII